MARLWACHSPPQTWTRRCCPVQRQPGPATPPCSMRAPRPPSAAGTEWGRGRGSVVWGCLRHKKNQPQGVNARGPPLPPLQVEELKAGAPYTQDMHACAHAHTHALARMLHTPHTTYRPHPNRMQHTRTIRAHPFHAHASRCATYHGVNVWHLQHHISEVLTTIAHWPGRSGVRHATWAEGGGEQGAVCRGCMGGRKHSQTT